MKFRTYEHSNTRLIASCIALFFSFMATTGNTQPHLSFEIKKPQKYESRTLPSEKTANSNYSLPKKLYTNTVSRFNYYFNANNKLNELVTKAKEAHHDDYTQLLSFYNYQLDTTAKDQIDSVIYKCTAGILLHDLRSNWVDKLYLLMGKAYLFRKDFDSASNVFQYINYAFAPKDNGYDIPIGSNASNTNGVFTIATHENRNLWKKITSFPPGRNESFILQARTYIEQDELVEAASLLEIIRTDPNFPDRLQTDLHEMTAYLLYKQQAYEGAAYHLTKALANADNKQETARWEFLAAQLYQLADKGSQAMALYERAIQHTTDPLMEVHARLNMVSVATGNQENAIQKNIDELLKMARRDKYETQRDIIYYAAAALELKRNNYTAAQNLLLKSIRYNDSDPLQRQKSFLLLGDLNYTRKAYSLSYAFYDSVQVAVLKENDQKRIEERKPGLKIISENQLIINQEDSLQKLASLSAEERNELVKKILKRLRKEKGLKDAAAEIPAYGNGLPQSSAPSGLFGSSTGDFYFQNTFLKAKGLGDFKTRWGNRPNVDNWRRQTAVDRSLNKSTILLAEKKGKDTLKQAEEKELSINALLKNIPLTAEQTDLSNKAIIKALLGSALTFQNQLEDYPSAIEMYEELARRFPESADLEQAFFNLAYCYKKTEQFSKADSVSARLKKSFSGGKYAAQLNTVVMEKKSDPARQKYESIYRLFIEGKFDQAKEAKLLADKQFGKSYWTPQLLYIESVYYIKQKEDSVAIDRLKNIISLFDKSPLAEKATTMIDVLRRRNEIESYLTNLNVEKTDEALTRRVDLNSTNPLPVNISKIDSTSKTPKELKATAKELANLSNTNTITSAPFASSDSLKMAPKEIKAKEVLTDTKAKIFNNNTFSFNPADTQYVVLILDNVDPIFASEGRNAFNRFNQDRYPDKKIEIFNRRINAQYQFLMFGPFVNAGEAITYIDKTKPLAGTRIIPWLTAEKFSFIIISNDNMSVLLNKQDVAGYRTFMHGVFADKF